MHVGRRRFALFSMRDIERLEQYTRPFASNNLAVPGEVGDDAANELLEIGNI